MSHNEIHDIYELSPLQEGILFHGLYTAGSAVYVNQLAFTLHGDLDISSLRAAWKEVAGRHPVLRTSFHWESLDRAVQVVHREVEIPWRELDEKDLPEGQSGLEKAELEMGFDFASAPLMRLVLVRLAEGGYRLVWTHHHILLDGWSLPLVLGEVFSLYEANRRGEPLVLPPARSYGDYIAWLQGQDLERAEAFWRRTLRGFTTPVRLASETVNSDPGTYPIAHRNLSPADREAVEAFCREHRLTASTLVLGAWGLLMSRVSGSEDVLFGATVSGRPADLHGVESMVGLFINTLPVRLIMPGDRPLLAWLCDLQESLTEAREFEYSPLTEIQRWSDVPRGTPLFDSLVVYENYPLDALRQRSPRSLQVGEVRSSESTGYPLTLQASQSRGELSLRLTYDEHLFEHGAAERLLSHTANLLVGFASRPDGRIADLSPLSPEERHQLLFGWNTTDRPYPLNRCLHHWIEDQVERSPDAVAVELDEERLTYRELDQRAGLLARHLRGRGAGPEERVAVCMERSLEMVISLLGILKAGAAYVPLDPEYPRERLAFMLSDSQPRMLLIQESLRDRLPGWEGTVLCLDSQSWGEDRGGDLEGFESPDQPAYVIYTSGSTGRPKGVVVPHRGVCNRLLWMQEAYGLTPEDRVLQKTPFSFDVSVWEFFWPLMVGARLVLARPGGHRDGAYLADTIAGRRITTLHFVPSMLQAFLEEPDLEKCRGLKRVLCSGEALPRRLQDRFAERIGTELHNLYGPTEASIDVTAWACQGDDLPTVPIGRPIANTRIYVLDRFLEPVPEGVAGELCIAGVGLARGYLGRPELTAERFVPDPVSARGERIYRTGDLVRWLPDGSLDFLGRLDHQVKVRGFRVEAGEIEAALCEHPDVREAVVVARADSPGENRLVAYLVTVGERPGIEELRGALESSLPDYMVPSAFVFLETLPLSPNGKVDRGALPAPEASRPALSGELAAPRTYSEEVLAAVWSRVLDVDPIGIDDNFFALGGDSIRALRVLALARERGLSLTLQHLFRHRSIRELAAGLDAGSSAAPGRRGPFSLVSEADRSRLPAGLDDAYPLTLLQAGMFFHSEAAPGEAVFHDVYSIRLAAPLQASTLRAALDRLASRHPVLRTSFELARYSEPLQLVHAEALIPLAWVDLRSLGEADREQAVRAWIEGEKARPFDPARVPLLRYAVHALEEGIFQLTLGFHHAILDGWSVASLTVELFRTCFSLAPDGSPPPAALFRHFIALEREALASEDARRFWADRLRDSAPTLAPRWPLPASTAKGGACRWDVPLEDDVSAGLLRLARLAGVPLKSVLLAAHLRVLSLLSGSGDVVTGVVSNGRPEETDGDRVLGLFLNTLPFRLVLPEGSWLSLVEATFEAEREALPHRRFPMAEMRRELGGQPLFETAFVFVQFHVYRDLPRSERVKVLSTEFFEETELPLGATFSLQTDPVLRVRCVLEHKPGELGPDEIARIAGWYTATLGAMAADPEALSEIAGLLSPPERHQLLVEWNDSAAPFPADLCLHRRFEVRARHQPESWAVLSEEGDLRYGELDAAADRLAWELAALGVGPEVPVGLCVERSPAMLVGILGILKAGGTYVPLDPESPPDRLAGILEGVRAPVVLTQERLAARLPETTERLFLEPFATPPFPLHGETPKVESGVTPDHLACVIHTSGSTGRPKGVMITHRAAGNAVSARQLATGMSAADRVLQNIHITFDPSVWQCFGTLTAGATLVLPRSGWQHDAAYLARLIEEHGITLFDLPPSIFQAFIDALEIYPCRSLRVVFTGGEPLPVEEMESLLARLPVAFHNLYGPTETTIDATYWSPGGLRRPSLPIGRPALNKRLLVLDDHFQQPVPAGVIGMVYIGGEGLARGYLGRSDLTAEAFVPDAVTGEMGARLYQTGDLARHLPDGNLEFAGRLDGQVKIRGRRIETGEVEAVLASHPGVRKVLVMAREKGQNDRRLVAYVVPEVPESGSATAGLSTDLRRFAREKLPEPMTPSAFVVLEGLPVRPSGKIDVAALPEPDWADQPGAAAYVAPSGPAEEMVAAIWAEVLGLPRAGTRDDFFALGGHSLLALRAMARVRDAFGIDVPLRVLFDAPSPAEMAARIAEELRAGAGLLAPPIARAPRGGALPLSFAQQRLWFLDRFEPGSAAYNIPVALRLSGPLDPVALRWSLEEIVRRHEVLRSVFPEVGGEPVQIVLPEACFAFETVEIDQPDLEREIARRAVDDARRLFDLARGPLLRATLLRSDDEENALLLCLHHVVSDGWSIGVLFSELWTLYEVFRNGQPSPLPELPVQYADYAVWQREWLQGEVLARQLSWWRQHLGDHPPVLDLPADRPRPAVRTSRGATLGFSLPREVTGSLESLARREGATLFMGLLSAFSALLYRYSGQEGAVVGTPMANRGRSEVEGLIGLFLNTLPLRVDLSGGMAFTDLLRRVRATTVDAYAHQDVPFEKLVEELEPQRDLSRTPLFQVMLVLQSAPAAGAAPAGLTLSPVPAHSGTAKFDLVLTLGEGREGLGGVWEYSTDLFDPETIERMAAHFEVLLSASLASPDLGVGALPLLRPAERQQLLAWSGPDREVHLEEGCLHRIFASRAAERPEAVALSFEGEAVAYGALERAANRLANHLRSLGVGPETLVGICVPRTPRMLVALLGVLKAGGAYVPLDPEYPKERLAFLIEDSRMPVIVTEEELLSRLPAHGARTVCLDRDAELLARESDRDPGVDMTPENLAYVIYTSGSTGRPKGVPVSHNRVARLFAVSQDLFSFGPEDVWTLFHSFAFDFSVWEIWGALLYGGRLVVVPFWVSRSPDSFLELLQRERVTVLNQTPSAFRQLIEIDQALDPAPELALRWIVFGGEALDPRSLRPWFERRGDRARLVNMYGITETTVHVTFRPLQAAEAAQGAGSVIGRALPDLQLLVLNREGEVAPAGVAGEIFVGGSGLARGYLGRPDLTAERFLPNPFGPPGSRLYRSGDLARWLPGGDAEYLGRADHQVKVRGFRIELGEIEAVLESHPAVHQTVVMAREDEPGEVRLVAYIVAGGDPAPTISDLRAFAARHLPDPMLPTAVVLLESLPLTAHGKVDRRTLPAPDRVRPELGAAYEPPGTPVERDLAAILAETLGLDRVGMRDNFFDLGGQSLLAVKVVSRIRNTLGVDLPLRVLFGAPTIGDLVYEVARLQAERAGEEELASLLAELEGMSEDEAAARLEEG